MERIDKIWKVFVTNTDQKSFYMKETRMILTKLDEILGPNYLIQPSQFGFTISKLRK